MAVILYAGQAIIPGPQVVITRQEEHSEGGQTTRIFYNIVVKGKMFAWKGSPSSAGVFYTSSGYPADENITQTSRLAAILKKQGALLKLFATDGQLFEIQPWDASAATTFHPRVKSVEFEQGPWTEYCNYVINLEADCINFGGIEPVCGGSSQVATPPLESWEFSPADDKGRVFKLTHTAKAHGSRKYNPDGTVLAEGWQVARELVLGFATFVSDAVNKLGYANAPSGILTKPEDLSGQTSYNHLFTQNIDEAGGNYTATESWLLFDTALTPDGVGAGIAANEEFTCQIRTSGDDGRTQVTLEGTITGFGTGETPAAIQASRAANAAAKYAAISSSFITRAQSLSGRNMNPVPLVNQKGVNLVAGTTSYNVEYNNRPIASSVVAGALSVSIGVGDDNPNDVFASIVVLGRAAGPVLQSIGTITNSIKNLSIEVAMPAGTVDGFAAQPNTDALVLSYRPTAAQVFVGSDKPFWNKYTGRYTRNTSWTYQ